MKKFVSLILVLCMLCGAFLFASSAQVETTYGYLQGDVDDDGTFNMTDLLALRKLMLGILAEREVCREGADIDEDGEVSMVDLLEMRKRLLGLEPSVGINADGRYKLGQLSIANRNISRFTIVYPDGNECMEYSAKELRRYIGVACGVTLNLTKNESEVKGYKIKYIFDTENNYDLDRDGYHVEVDGEGNLLFYCGSMRAPLYVTYYFLEEIVGYRFLVSDFSKYDEISGFKRDGFVEYLYENEKIDLHEGFAETEVPVMEYRALSQNGPTEDNFAKLRLNACDAAGSNRGASAKYGWVLGTTLAHGHSFMYTCGAGDSDWQVYYCHSDETIFNQIVEGSIKHLEGKIAGGQRPGETFTQLSCSPNDTEDFCLCAQCKRGYEEDGSVTGPLFRLVNRVAQVMEEKYPGMYLFTINYKDGGKAPAITRPHENITVAIYVAGCNNHSFFDRETCAANGGNPRTTYTNYGYTTNPSNASSLNALDGWSELTDNIYAWYCVTNYGYYMSPSPNIFNIYEDVKYMAEHGVKGIYNEGSDHAYWSFEWLRGQLLSEMMWNPFMTEEEFNDILNEYLMIYYGEGWQYIREYLEMSNHAADLEGCFINNFDWVFDMYNKAYFGENYQYMAGLFDKAYEAAETEEQKYRVAICSMHCHFIGLSASYESHYVNGSAQDRILYEARYNKYRDDVEKYNIPVTNYQEDGYGCQKFPAKGDPIVSPLDWIFEGGFTGER